jgi:hypothetical protein
MQYIGGVFSGEWKITFTCVNPSRQWVSVNTRAAWEAARRDDPGATYFLSPLLDQPDAMPEFHRDEDQKDRPWRRPR